MKNSKPRRRRFAGWIVVPMSLTFAMTVAMTSGCGEEQNVVVEQPDDFKILTPDELAERNRQRDLEMAGAAEERTDEKP